MLAGRRSSKETTTLHWQMSDDAWVHWAQGLGETSVRDVILERIDQIRKNSEVLEVVRGRCEAFAQEVPREHGQPSKHEIKIQLPAVDWAVACQRIGRSRPSRILAALIRESASWQQVGNDDNEFNAGYNEDSLVSSLCSLTATTAGLSLGSEEKILARIVACAAVVGAVATVAIAIAAWCNP